MKQSQRRHFKHSGCDCRECVSRNGRFQEFGYAALVAILLVASFAALLVISEFVFPSTQIVK